MMQRPESLYSLISENFKKDFELLCEELEVDIEELSGSTRSIRALSLQQHLENHARLHELLATLHQERAHLDLKPYLYLVIAEQFSTEQAMVGLLEGFGVTVRHFMEQEKHPWGQKAWREQKALAIQTYMEANGRITELIKAIQQRNSSIDLSFYLDQPKPANEPKPKVAVPKAVEIIQYQNFDVVIGQRTEKGYPTTLRNSPRGPMLDNPIYQVVDLDDPGFSDPIRYLGGLVAKPNDTKQLGEQLQKLLLPGKIGELYRQCLNDVTTTQGLRIRLQIHRDAAELGRLPWEYAYIPDNNEFIALTRTTPIVRYIERNYKVKPLATAHPRLLIILASPEHPGLVPLDQADEQQRIEKALSPLEGVLEWEFMTEATYDKLQKKLTEGEGFDILHFIGHGLITEAGVGALAFENEEGGLHEIDYEQFSVLLRHTGIKLIVLTACQTSDFGEGDIFKGVAQSLVQAEIPAVIAMQFVVEYKIAQEFIGQFYYYLAAQQPLDKALTEARISAYSRESKKLSWGIPVLFMQSPDGVIWQPAAP